jgi:hypothetical protein
VSRLLALVTIGALTAGLLVLPGPNQPGTGSPPARAGSTFAVCPVIEGGGRTTELGVVSHTDGAVALTLFANGGSVGSIGVTLGEDGSTVIPVVDVAAVGTVGGLIELPSAESAASSRIQGAESVTLEACVTDIPAQVALTGAATAGERDFDLHLMNPFAGDAVATLTVVSEVGVESNTRFETVTVPSRGLVVLPMSQLIPGRQEISVTVDVTRGRVIAAGRQTEGQGAAMWNAVAPATDWFLPIPSDGSKVVIVGNPSEGDVEYQIDLYGPEGVEAAAEFGVIEEGASMALDLTEYPGVRAVRVVTALPVVTSLQVRDEGTLSVTTGAPVATGSWLVPAALEGGSVRIVVLNPDLEDASVVITALRGSPVEFRVTVPAESVLELSLDGTDGYRVDADIPVVALLAGKGPGYTVLAVGVPVDDG